MKGRGKERGERGAERKERVSMWFRETEKVINRQRESERRKL